MEHGEEKDQKLSRGGNGHSAGAHGEDYNEREQAAAFEGVQINQNFDRKSSS